MFLDGSDYFPLSKIYQVLYNVSYLDSMIFLFSLNMKKRDFETPKTKIKVSKVHG